MGKLDMTATIAIAALGFAATLAASVLTAHLQRRSAVANRLLDAKIEAYGECAETLYEFARVSFNRVRARLEAKSDESRVPLRQEFYRCGASARAVLARVSLLSDDTSLVEELQGIREAIGEMQQAPTPNDLTQLQRSIHDALSKALASARSDLEKGSR